jgi:tetratricopeptide (TPR) repeat protein/O-antigen ligase
MNTRISRFADKMMEATVLVAVLAIPLLLNPYSARVFEGEKASLLRALAAIAAIAWLVRSLEVRTGNQRPSRSGHRSAPRRNQGERQDTALRHAQDTPLRHPWGSILREQPAVFAALFAGLVVVVAGVTSITPRLSLWGSYQRGQGIITTVSYLTLFLVTIATFSIADRRRRLVATLLAASAPVALLSFIQFSGFDPLPLRSLELSRVYATLSNPIFLGAYLVMVIPLTLAQIVRYGLSGEGVRWGGLVGYALLLILQLAAVGFSNSRGPALGLLAGGFLFFLLLALQSRRRWIAAALLFIAALGLVVLLALSLPNTPLGSLKNVPVIGRFSQITNSGSARVRVLIWQGVVDRFAGQPARLALGYGPESTQAALGPTYQPELRHLESQRLPDRAHNVIFEALVTTGLLGVASILLLFAALFYTGLRGLGLISTTRSRNQWLVLTVAGVAVGALLPRLIAGNWTFAGFGTGIGLAAGLAAYLFLRLWQLEPDSDVLSHRSVLIAGILAALAGHLVEITVGIRVTATESLFWVLAGLLVVLSTTRVPLQASAESAPRKSVPSPEAGGGITLIWDAESAALGLLGGLMLSTLAFGTFLLPGTNVPTSAGGRWVLLIGAWVLAGPLWLSPPDVTARSGTGWLYPLISAGWAALFVALRSIVPLLGGDALTLLNLYFGWLLLSLVIVAVLLPRRPAPVGTSQAWMTVVYAALGAVALGAVAWLAVKPLYADIYLEAAQANAAAGQWSPALAFYQKAADESPGVDVYQQHLGEAFVRAARLVQDPKQREALFQAGQESFRRAVALNPTEGTHRFNLAHLYSLWGQATTDSAQQATRLREAAKLYEQASSQTPNDPRVLTEWGQVLQAQGNADAALAKYRAALDLDPRDAQAYLQMGILYHSQGKTGQALQMYRQAIDLDPERVEAYRALADLYREEGRLMDAVEAQQRAAELQPTDYTIHQNLALLYRDLGQIQSAVMEARLALNYAPADKQAALQGFIESLLTASAP